MNPIALFKLMMEYRKSSIGIFIIVFAGVWSSLWIHAYFAKAADYEEVKTQQQTIQTEQRALINKMDTHILLGNTMLKLDLEKKIEELAIKKIEGTATSKELVRLGSYLRTLEIITTSSNIPPHQ